MESSKKIDKELLFSSCFLKMGDFSILDEDDVGRYGR
jgi:hypothetical protein